MGPVDRLQDAADHDTDAEPGSTGSQPGSADSAATAARSMEPRTRLEYAGDVRPPGREAHSPQEAHLPRPEPTRHGLDEPTGTRRERSVPERQVGAETAPDCTGEPAASEADQPRRLTEEEWAEHLSQVCDRLDKARADGLISKRQHTIDGAGQVWTEERDRLHDAIIEDLYAKVANVPCDAKAIMAGGLGGAGKTTVLTEQAGIDLSQYLMINPDDMKEQMAYHGMIPEIDGLSPMEASDLVHEESSYLANQLAQRAYVDGKNLIWDITMSSEKSTVTRLNELSAAGYSRIDGLFVDIPIETSLSRIESRHREGHDRYLAGDGLGGRYVPPEVTYDQQDPVWSSQNRKTFDAMKPRFTDWSIYDNSITGRSASLVETSKNRP
jgi:predicted ABC-type ATPase